MKKLLATSVLLLAAFCLSDAQVQGEDVYIHHEGIAAARQELRIPDIEGYLTLKGDFHLHTVFSDGNVWPDYRVEEALRNGLDVIAMTDHVEYRPKSDYFIRNKSDLNESFRIAAEAAADKDIIVIPGTEITRSKPFGHMNALFVTDANEADRKDQMDALNAMVAQGAYILWNHPGWPDDKCTMYPVHEELIAKGIIKGVEIFNDVESYPLAYDWIDRYGLHPFANSDAHGPVDPYYSGKRPMTLVFAEEKTLDGVKEAMFAGRTVALFADNLMGKEELIAKMVDACLDFVKESDNDYFNRYKVVNDSDIRFIMEFESGTCPVMVEPRSEVKVDLRKGEKITFANCFLGKGRCYMLSESEF